MTRERAVVGALLLLGTLGPSCSGVVSALALRIGAPGAALEVRRGAVDARTLTFVKEGIRIAP